MVIFGYCCSFEELDSDVSIETTQKGYSRIIVDEGTIFRE
jgi:hypothetical protein